MSPKVLLVPTRLGDLTSLEFLFLTLHLGAHSNPKSQGQREENEKIIRGLTGAAAKHGQTDILRALPLPRHWSSFDHVWAGAASEGQRALLEQCLAEHGKDDHSLRIAVNHAALRGRHDLVAWLREMGAPEVDPDGAVGLKDLPLFEKSSQLYPEFLENRFKRVRVLYAACQVSAIDMLPHLIAIPQMATQTNLRLLFLESVKRGPRRLTSTISHFN